MAKNGIENGFRVLQERVKMFFRAGCGMVVQVLRDIKYQYNLKRRQFFEEGWLLDIGVI